MVTCKVSSCLWCSSTSCIDKLHRWTKILNNLLCGLDSIQFWRVVELCGVDAAGGSEERSWCVIKAFGRIAGEGAAHGTPDKVSPSDGGSVVKLQLCKLSMEFYSESQNEAVLLSLNPFALIALSLIPSKSTMSVVLSCSVNVTVWWGALVLLPSGEGTF